MLNPFHAKCLIPFKKIKYYTRNRLTLKVFCVIICNYLPCIYIRTQHFNCVLHHSSIHQETPPSYFEERICYLIEFFYFNEGLWSWVMTNIKIHYVICVFRRWESSVSMTGSSKMLKLCRHYYLTVGKQIAIRTLIEALSNTQLCWF